ncbi:MAG: hypothetical protein SGJ17_00405 [Hyphomicrobiales bacterium]|nr:hypothetical protein [Hyphomicrobiales bacterium]
MAAVEELERRVTALEVAQNDTTQTMRWVVARLGRMSAVQDEHTLRLERIETQFGRMDAKVDRVDLELRSFREDLPGIIVEAVREALRKD